MSTLKRSLILMTGFIAFFALQGCEKEDDHRLQLSFYYQNNSDRALVINHYRSNSQVEFFRLNPHSSVLALNINTEGSKDHQPADFGKFFQQNAIVDSVYIIFDVQRLQRYTLNDGKARNILEVANYQASEKEKNKFEFVYEFTEADFESAEE